MKKEKTQPDKSGSSEQIHPMPKDLEGGELKGPIRELKQSLFKAKNKKGEITCGKPVENDHRLFNYLLRFNEKGLKIEEQRLENNSVKYHFFYNEFGKSYKEISYEKSGEISFIANCVYNDNGLQLERNIVKADGTLMWKYLYEYNNKGLKISVKDIYPNESRNMINTFKYDDNDHCIESKSTEANGNVSHWNRTKFDEHGKATELKRLNYDGTFETFYYHHDYDSEGNIITPNYFKPKKDSEIYEFSWEKDHHGNWIEKVEYYKNIPVTIYVREINYFGEESKKSLVNKMESTEETMKMKNTKDKANENTVNSVSKIAIPSYPQLNYEQAKWLADGSTQDFNMLRYYIIINNDMPSNYTYVSMDIEAIALLEELKDNMDAQCLHTNILNYSDDREERLIRYTLSFPDKGYLLNAMQIQSRDEYEYDVPSFIKNYHKSNDGNVYTSQIVVLRPGDASGKRNKDFEAELQQYIDKCTLEKIPEKPSIYMVESGGNGYCLRSHAINDDFEIKSLDTNYGYGFEKFHNELMGRFKSETKGLILFHGEPGTGKTYYIRHLLRTMTSNGKVVIYMPPNMVDYLVEPGFMTFLSAEISNFSEEGYFCALLIEDAEPLLAARQGDVRIQGVSNLLNMTDGLLNDMLDLQIICTFNVKLKELDKALLRPGRLLARKEFKRLSALDANILGQQLGVKHHFTAPATIAEVYAMLNNKGTVLHGVGDRDEEE